MMYLRSFPTVLLAVSLLILSTALPKPAGAQEGSFAGTSTVVAVEVPVNVVRNGEPVRGLTIDDFEVLDRGEARPLLGFEVMDLEIEDIGGKGSTAMPTVAQRHFLLLFDLAYSRTKTLKRSIAGSRDLVESLHPTDRVGVAFFGHAGGARLVLSFTADHRQVERVLQTLEDLLDRKVKPEDLKPGDDGNDPLRLIASNTSALAAEIGRTAGIEYSSSGQFLNEMALMGGSNSGAFGVPDLQEEALEDYNEITSKELKSRQRAEAMTLARSLGELAKVTRGIEGRKYLVYLSEGFQSHLLEGRGASGFLREMQNSFEAFRQAGWSIQSVDSGGVRGLDERFDTTGSLVFLAKETDGDLYQNFNNLGEAMGTMLTKTSVTYVLVFQSPEIAQDGSFHPIQVRLKNQPRAQVRHRAGYYAPNPLEKPSGIEGLLATGETILSKEEGGSLGMATLVKSFRSPTGTGLAGAACDVSIWVEVSGKVLASVAVGDSLQMRLFVYALGDDGKVQDFFAQTVLLDEGRIQGRLSQGGDLKFYGDLELEPGTYTLRVLVRSGEDGPYSLRSVPLEVEDLSGSEPRLLGSVFFDDPKRPSIVSRLNTMDASGVERYPYWMGENRYYPLVNPRLTYDQPARLAVMAYDIGDLLLETAAIYRQDGTQIEGDVVEMIGKENQDGLDQIFFDVQSEALEPGVYALRVALVDPETAKTYSSTAMFELMQ